MLHLCFWVQILIVKWFRDTYAAAEHRAAFREVFGNHRKIKQGQHYTVAMAERKG